MPDMKQPCAARGAPPAAGAASGQSSAMLLDLHCFAGDSRCEHELRHCSLGYSVGIPQSFSWEGG